MSDPDIYMMTSTEAGAELDRMSAQLAGSAPPEKPTAAQEAAARLDLLSKDKGFHDRLMAGDPATKREFAELTALKAGAAAGNLAGEAALIETVDAVSDPNAVSGRIYNGLIEALREQGLPDAAEQYIRDIDAGQRTDRPTAGDKVACQEAFNRLSKNPEWVRAALTSGSDESNLRNALARMIAYAADDGLPLSADVQQILREFGLR